MIMTQVKSYLAKTIKECGINILEIDERLMELSEELRIRLNCFLQNYGLEMPEFFVSRIATPDDDPDFKRMKQQYADQYLLIRQEQIKRSEAEAAQAWKAVEAQTEAQMKIIEAQGKAEVLRIQKQAEADAYRMQAEAEATEMHLKGYTYQQETARQVGLGATKAMANGGSGSGIGEIANLGMTLGAMGSVIGMTKDAMDGITAGGSSLGQTTAATIAGASTWDCPNCGNKNISTKFCPECGTKREG
jgi:membrane protease subunit (stomatin/prohibitin family)